MLKFSLPRDSRKRSLRENVDLLFFQTMKRLEEFVLTSVVAFGLTVETLSPKSTPNPAF